MDLDAKAGRFIALGMEFGATVVAGVLAGYYLDMYVGTPPLFTLLFTLGGMGGALYRLIWSLKQSSNVSDLPSHDDQQGKTPNNNAGRRP